MAGASGSLDGRVAIVTGSTRGLGRGIAERFAAEGAHVVAHGRSGATAETVAAGLPSHAIGVGGDIADPQTAERLVAAAVEAWGHLDIVVNNAGVVGDGFVTRITDDAWRQTLDTNLSGAFYVTRAAVPHLKEAGGGAIVNVVSWSGLRGNVGQAAYAASKAGLHGLTLALAKELAKFEIRVNAVSPAVETDMSDAMPPELKEKVAVRRPLRRPGSVADVAEAVLFLASDRARFTTGEVLHVDGGLHLT